MSQKMVTISAEELAALRDKASKVADRPFSIEVKTGISKSSGREYSGYVIKGNHPQHYLTRTVLEGILDNVAAVRTCLANSK